VNDVAAAGDAVNDVAAAGDAAVLGDAAVYDAAAAVSDNGRMDAIVVAAAICAPVVAAVQQLRTAAVAGHISKVGATQQGG